LVAAAVAVVVVGPRTCAVGTVAVAGVKVDRD